MLFVNPLVPPGERSLSRLPAPRPKETAASPSAGATGVERTHRKRWPRPGRVIFWITVAFLILALARIFDLPGVLTRSLSWIDSLGPIGPIVFIFVYVLATVLFVPGSALTLGAGAIFGVFAGSIYVSIGATLGATAAFLIGRHLARDRIARRIEANPKFNAIDEAVAREGWKIVGLVRLSPVFPFNLLNYAFGVTRVSLRDYFWASWIGMIPGTVMYVYIGSLGRNLAAGRSRTPAEWMLYALGLAATVGVTLFVTRLARRALEQRIS